MPLTPLHLAVCLPVRKQVSIAAFIIPNILIDMETLLILLFGMDKLGYPLHGNVHTLIGATVMITVTLVIGLFAGQKTKYKKWFYGAVLGGYSHILIDSLAHSDVRPFAPLMENNPLFLDAHLAVSVTCAVVLSYYLAKWVESLAISEVFSSWLKSIRW